MSLAWASRPVADDIRGLEIIGWDKAIVRFASRPAHDLGWVRIRGVDVWEVVAVPDTVHHDVGDMAMSCHGNYHGNDGEYEFHCLRNSRSMTSML
jgi:hypothetical protein